MGWSPTKTRRYAKPTTKREYERMHARALSVKDRERTLRVSETFRLVMLKLFPKASQAEIARAVDLPVAAITKIMCCETYGYDRLEPVLARIAAYIERMKA